MAASKIKINLSVDAALWKRFRIYCLERGVTASAEVEESMRRKLDKQKS